MGSLEHSTLESGFETRHVAAEGPHHVAAGRDWGRLGGGGWREARGGLEQPLYPLLPGGQGVTRRGSWVRTAEGEPTD